MTTFSPSEATVAQAAPAMPIAGKPAKPKIQIHKATTPPAHERARD